MYILFINSNGKCDIFFSAQFNNNSNKKNFQPIGSTQPNPTQPIWVRLNFFFDPPWWVGPKNPLNPTQPDPCTSLDSGI